MTPHPPGTPRISPADGDDRAAAEAADAARRERESRLRSEKAARQIEKAEKAAADARAAAQRAEEEQARREEAAATRIQATMRGKASFDGGRFYVQILPSVLCIFLHVAQAGFSCSLESTWRETEGNGRSVPPNSRPRNLTILCGPF